LFYDSLKYGSTYADVDPGGKTLARFPQPVWDGMPIQGYRHGTRGPFTQD